MLIPKKEWRKEGMKIMKMSRWRGKSIRQRVETGV